MKLALITFIVFYSCIAIGIIYQYLLIHTKLLDRIRLRNHPANPIRVRQHMKLVTINLCILAGLIFISLAPFSHLFSITTPSLWLGISQFLIIIVLDDIGFYVWHRMLHENRFLLRKIHVIHHQARYPAPLEFIYAHPVEWMVGSAGLVVGIIINIHIFGTMNAYVLWAYGIFRTLHELDLHSSTRSIFCKYIPLVANVKHHDVHHLRAIGNYASTFTYLDKLLRTETKTFLEKTQPKT